MPFDIMPSVYAVALILSVATLAVALYVFYGVLENIVGERVIEELTDEGE